MALTCPIMLANCELWCKRYGEIGSGMLILVPTSSTILCVCSEFSCLKWDRHKILQYHMIHPRNGSVWLATTRATSFAINVLPISPTTWLPAPSMLWINIGMIIDNSYPELWNREIEEPLFWMMQDSQIYFYVVLVTAYLTLFQCAYISLPMRCFVGPGQIRPLQDIMVCDALFEPGGGFVDRWKCNSWTPHIWSHVGWSRSFHSRSTLACYSRLSSMGKTKQMAVPCLDMQYCCQLCRPNTFRLHLH